MDELTPELRGFLDSNRVGVLATIGEHGRPRQSLVYYVRDDNVLLISTLAQRLKATDVQRSEWASLCVMGHESPYPSAVFSGPADIVKKDIGQATALIMQRIAGKPPSARPRRSTGVRYARNSRMGTFTVEAGA